MKSRVLLVVVLGALLGLGAAFGVLTVADESTAASGTSPSGPNDALTAARFEISIDGHSLAQFSELAGISSGFDTQELELLTRGSEVQLRVPGKRKPTAVTLRRGMNNSFELQAWHDLALAGDPAARRTASLTMYDTTGDPVARYHLENAWPSKLEIDTLSAGASHVLFETVTIVAERVQRVSP
jgi:phage tail-like protein